MDTKELKKKRSEKVAQLKSICKDPAFAKVLIDDIISLTGQIGVEPMALFVREDDIDCQVEADTFRIFATPTKAVFQNKGGYAVGVDKETNDFALVTESCYQTLYDTLRFVASKWEELDGEKDNDLRENHMAFVKALSYCMQIPAFAIMDIDFMIGLARECVQFLAKKIEDAVNAAPQAEDEAANKAFEELTKTISEAGDEKSLN